MENKKVLGKSLPELVEENTREKIKGLNLKGEGEYDATLLMKMINEYIEKAQKGN